MATLLKQGKQIANSKIYEDIDLGQQNQNRDYIAKDATTLEQDLNVIRSILTDIHGEEKWTDAPKITLQELDAFVLAHNKMFHHDRDEKIKLFFDYNEILTDIKTYGAENLLLVHTSFGYLEDVLSVIEKITYTTDGSNIFQHIKKTFVYDDGNNLEKIVNEKIV